MQLELFVTEVLSDGRGGRSGGGGIDNKTSITIEPHYRMEDEIRSPVGVGGVVVVDDFPSSPCIPFLQDPFQRSIGQFMYLDKGLSKQYPFHLFISLSSIKESQEPILVLDRYLNHILSFASFPDDIHPPSKDPLFLAFLSNPSFPSIEDGVGFIDKIYKLLAITSKTARVRESDDLLGDENERLLRLAFLKADKRITIMKSLLDMLILSLEDTEDLNKFITTKIHPLLKDTTLTMPNLTTSPFTPLKEQIPLLRMIVETEHDTISQYHKDKISKSLQRIYDLRLSLTRITDPPKIATTQNQIELLLQDVRQYHVMFHKQIMPFWKDSNNLLKIN